MSVFRVQQALGHPPPRPTPLVGREEELLLASHLLSAPQVQLLTLRGPGGIGKTRLALEIASTLGPAFDLGAVWVSLASLQEPGEVMLAVAHALGAPSALQADLAEEIGDRSLLLILDNFEHLTPAAPDVAALAASTPGLRVLTTSRTALRVCGEHELPVGPLSLPSASVPGQVSAAVRLFVFCARAVDPRFDLTATNEPAISRICHLLDGIPLALELAAPRLRAVPPEGLLEWLEQPLEVLTDGPRDGPHHGDSLRSTIGWSVDLLTPEQRDVFAACGAFIGGFTLPALTAVTGLASTRRALLRLIEHSLLQPVEGPEPRWRPLEPVREFAAELLDSLSEADVLRERHARHYLALAEEFRLSAQGYDQEWLTRLGADDANLTAALRWLVQTQQTSLALRLVRAMGGYWDHDATQKHHDWLCQVVALPGAHEEPALLADALCALGLTSRNLQQLEQARQALQDAGALYRQLGDTSGETDVLLILASVHSGAGEHDQALELFRRVEVIFEGLNNRIRLNDVANNLGVSYLRLGQPAEAFRCFERTEALSQEMNSELGLAFARGLLSWSAYLQGKLDIALPLVPVAWQHTLQVPNALLRYTMLHHLAFHARDAGQLRLAARLVGCSEAMRASTGEPWDSCFQPHAQRLDAALRAEMGAQYLEGRAEGGQLRFDDLVPEVQALLDRLATAPASAGDASPLTSRERDVLRLLARGIPDKKIAQHLHISATTVSKHVSSMLGKLEVHNRVELARWALERGLVDESTS